VRIDEPVQVPGVELIPGLLRQLVPQDGGDKGAGNIRNNNKAVVECPAGTFKDNNGRCVSLQKD
jgi:hypothetical protein